MQYDQLIERIQAERDQIAADYEALAERHADALDAARAAALAYRSVLYGAQDRGALDSAGTAELELTEDLHATAVDQ
ncbi:hypothetical protein [Glycomyces paridis]|uniref:Uncharacterized protein n=1 Tax=Glycomyces paridis TaxID=2126555 RepID=A0A4S8P6X5_9ACTN|nr:hypothetical protein [Glycomyces paridis]THV26018.1 hypothetical protein E9998_20010 [Glycomyces paridis]